LLEEHLDQLDQQMAQLLAQHHAAVQRLAEVPGLGLNSAQQIIAEVGARAATFPSPKHLASWMGACPDTEESAGVNYSHRCPKGNRQMRRVLNQAANAAVKAKGTIFAIVYRRLVPRLGHAQAFGAITHRLCRLIWKILHQGIRYEERGPAVSAEAKKVRARKMIRELRSLGYHVELLSAPSSSPARSRTIFDPGVRQWPREPIFDNPTARYGGSIRYSRNSLGWQARCSRPQRCARGEDNAPQASSKALS
jgi:transposase